jgi:hypothetical protein
LATVSALIAGLGGSASRARALEPRLPAPDPRNVAADLVPATSHTGWGSWYIASKAHLAATHRMLRTVLHRRRAKEKAENGADKAENGADDAARSSGSARERHRPAFLSRRHLRRRLARLTPTVVRCLGRVGREAATVTLRLRIEGATGRVSEAKVVGAFARSPVHRCVAEAAQQLRFARFGQPSQWVTYPVIIRVR